MAEKYSLMGKYEWLGEFWYDGNEKKKISGLLRYSPENGITLRAFYQGRIREKIEKERETSNKERQVIFGNTIETGPISLLTEYPGDKLDYGFEGGASEEDIRCKIAIMGVHVPKDEFTFKEIAFRFSNLDNFCFPQGFKMEDAYSSSSQLDGEMELFRLELRKRGMATFAPRNISSLFIIEEEKMKTELDTAVNDVCRKYGNTNLHFKTEIDYCFYLISKKTNGESYKILLNNVMRVIRLFEILTLRPINISEMSLKSSAEESDGARWNQTLISQYISEERMRQINKDVDFHSLPLNIQCVKGQFNKILKEWEFFASREHNIVYKTLYDYFRGGVDSYQYYILQIAAVDQWCYWEGGHDINWFFDTYTNEDIKKQLYKYFPLKATRESIGIILKNVRNFIVHPPKATTNEYKIYKTLLEPIAVLNLTEIVFFILLLAIYEKIGLEKEIIDKISHDYKKHIGEYYSLAECQ